AAGRADLRRVGIVEARTVPRRGGLDVGVLEKGPVLAVGHRGSRDGERIEPHPMSWPLTGMAILPAHPEPSGGDLHQVHAVEYSLAMTPRRRAGAGIIAPS